MSISLSLSLSREFDHSSVFEVRTSKTFYQVVVGNLQIRVIGPGVDESYFIGTEVPEEMTREGQAIIAITLWEEGE